MANFLVGSDCDGGSHEMDDIKRVAAGLRSCGHEVRESPRCNPSFEGELTSSPDGTIGVMIANGGLAGATYASFIKDMQGMVPNSHIIFLFCHWAHPDSSTLTNESIQNDVCIAEHDSGGFYQSWMPAIYDGKTEAQLEQEYGFIHFCGSATSPEDGARMICEGVCGKGGGGTTITQSGGSMIKIPDLTFYGLIKQICGAVDATFTIANNMAYLLSFKDLYKYRDKYDEYIPILTADKIQNDTLTKNWTTDGFYNAVNITYNGGELEYKYEPLIEQYGENVFYYDLSEDDEETATAKAKALLSAHVRDYSLDLELRCLYDPHITTGSWIKLPTKITRMSVSQDKEIPKQNNNIQNRETTIETEYDIFYVQGYSLRWTTQNALIMDLHLKYGPDTPEDPVNATIGTGAVQTTQGTGGYGSDCFSVGDFCQLFGDHRIPHSGAGAVAYAKENTPDNNMTMPRARQGSTYDRDLAGKTAEEGFLHITSIAGYCLYAENCNKWCCVEDMYTSGECGFNCGDWSLFVKVMLDCVGVKSWGFHIDGHYFNMMEYNGEVMSIDASRRHDANTHSCGFPASSKGSCSCACVNGNLGVHTDSSSCNATSNNTQQK